MDSTTFTATADLQNELTALLDRAVRNETLSNLLAGTIGPEVDDSDEAVIVLNRVNAQIRADFARREAIRQVLMLREQAGKLELRISKARAVRASFNTNDPEMVLEQAIEAVIAEEQKHYARVIDELFQAEAVLRGEA